MTKRLGLIGFPLSHSFSPGYFREKFRREGLEEWDYHPFPLCAIEELPALLEDHPELCGLNVTIPYKEAVIPFLDELDDAAAAIGAVNTIRIVQGRTIGYNTDAPAFRQVLRVAGADAMPGALILGTGGASRAVAYVLAQEAIPFVRVSRTAGEGKISYGELDAGILGSHPLIVQTTPLGMYPLTEALPPLPYHLLGQDHLLIDLIYNPPETGFLREGAARGARGLNGLKMLYLQAELSWNIWTL